MKKLVLTLALIFNDIKSVAWASYQLGSIPPDSGTADPVVGQVIGMKDTFERMACGILNELGKVIRNHSQLLNLPRVRERIDGLAANQRDAWEDLVDLAHERRPRRRLREFYREIRDGLAFHYLGEDLLSEGYVSHFRAPQRHPARDRAFVSLGRNMEESRFFFADAASTAVRADLMGRHDVAPDVLIKFLKNANMALRFVIEAMLQVLEERMTRPAAEP